MNTPVTLNAIASDVIGHYGNAAKNIVAACRTASDRALAAGTRRYADLLGRARLPVVEERKARLIAAEQRMAKVIGQGVARVAQGYDRGIEFMSSQAVNGLETLAQRTDWAKNMFVVDTVRRINLPAARLSLEVASRVDGLASALSARAKGTTNPGVKRAAKKTGSVKRARRAA